MLSEDDVFDAQDEPGKPKTPNRREEVLLGRASLYALILRERGYAPDEGAYFVARRYPIARKRLAKFLPKAEVA